MRTIYKPLLVLAMVAGPALAGALRIEVSDAAANPEAQQKHALLVARVTACQSPEKALLTATAEGMVDGQRRSIPLQVIPLATAGTFAITREWPPAGSWVVKLVATNPDYKNYATAVLVPGEKGALHLSATEHYYHAPTEAEVSALLSRSAAVRASIN